MVAVVEKLAERLKAREAKRSSEFGTLVRKIGDGQEPKIEEVERILLEAGKNPDELAKAVEGYADRKRRYALVATEPKLLEERAKINIQLETLNRELEEAQKKYEDAAGPLQFRLLQIGQEVMVISQDRDKLANECPNVDVLAEWRATEQRVNEINQELAKARELQERARMNISDLEVRQGRTETNIYGEEIAAAKARLKGYESQLAELQKKLAEAMAASDAAWKKRILP